MPRLATYGGRGGTLTSVGGAEDDAPHKGSTPLPEVAAARSDEKAPSAVRE